MVAPGDSHSSSQPQPRPPLRVATGRQSTTGGATTSSPKAALFRSNSTRVSSPGGLGGGGGGGVGGSQGNSPTAVNAGTLPGFSLSTGGDLPRLPCVSESGEKGGNRPPASVMLRRNTTLSLMGRDQGPAPSPKDLTSSDTIAGLKKERNALRLDKNSLLLNKRRLEGLITRILEQPLPSEGEGLGAGSGHAHTGHTSRAPLLRASTFRAHLLKALDESTGLDAQLATTRGGGATLQPIPAFNEGTGDHGADVIAKELAAKMTQMQADHEAAIRHMESEMSYRRTQAAASTAGIQRQLSEAQEEVADLKRRLAASETQAQDYYIKVAELRLQVQALNGSLADKSKALADARDSLGLDKQTMSTVIDMLKAQLEEANADRAAKAALITELEYTIVHRDSLLAQAHDRLTVGAGAAVGAAACAGSASSEVVARVSQTAAAPLEGMGSLGTPTSNSGSSPSSQLNHHSHRRLVVPGKGSAEQGW